MAGSAHDVGAIPGAIPMSHWSRNYVGIPYLRAGRSVAGTDCYGLLWLVYRDVLCVDLASYAAETMDAVERAEVAALFADRVKSPWVSVPLEQEREFDMAVFRRAGIDSHVGVVVAPGRMLHIERLGTESHVETYSQGRWKTKLVAVHRHEACA